VVLDLARHPYFEPWTDPSSGVLSYLLVERVAPLQQSFYFTNPGVSADGRWLWFYAAYPPSPQRMLAVVGLDPDEASIRVFHDTCFWSASPMVAPEGDAACFCSRDAVWRKGLDGSIERLCRLPAEMKADVRGRLTHLGTHLTLSADGKHFLLDGRIGNQWFVALGDPRGGGVEVLHTFQRHYNHAQFSPTDPELFMIAQDWWVDPDSCVYHGLHHRIWLMDTRGRRFEPLRPTDWYARTAKGSHEWWSADGWVCWTDYERGAHECRPDGGEPTLIWPGPLCHTHCDPTRRYFCADQSPYQWPARPCEVRFFDRQAGREVHVVTAMPPPPIDRKGYHIDPHPQFSPCGGLVVYTTTVRGRVDVAVAPVEGILDRLGAGG